MMATRGRSGRAASDAFGGIEVLKISFDPQEILFGVHPYGVMLGFGHMDRYAILQKSKLLEPFSPFKL